MQNNKGFNRIFSQTYNFIYIRAFAMTGEEAAAEALLKRVYKTVYETMSGEEQEEALFEWLGKLVYNHGISFLKEQGIVTARREKTSELLAVTERELRPNTTLDTTETVALMEELLDTLPGVQLATMLAFYFDRLGIRTVADYFECSEALVKGRLNGARDALRGEIRRRKETNEQLVSFAVSILAQALRNYAGNHCLKATTAQELYDELCREIGNKPGSIHLEGRTFAGAMRTIADDNIEDELWEDERLQKKKERAKLDPKKVFVLAVVAALLLGLLVYGIAALTKKTQKPDQGQKKEKVTETKKEEPPAEAETEALEEETEKSPGKENHFIFPESNTKLLTAEELAGRSKEELRIGRNEIYARHGMTFEVEDLKTYFESQGWYTPSVPAGEFEARVNMSIIEEQNVTAIRNAEKALP